MIDDWETIPFTSVRVTDDKCTGSEVNVWERLWKGTEQGCLVNKLNTIGYGSQQVVMTKSEYDDYISRNTSKNTSRHQRMQREPCMPINMESPIVQDEFFDMRFCGTRGGSPFETAVRPKPTGEKDKYECPKGFTPCSPNTTVNNTICAESGKTEDCPITFMKFVPIA